MTSIEIVTTADDRSTAKYTPFLTKWGTFFLVAFGIYYMPIEGGAGFGPIHFFLMVAATGMMLATITLSRALMVGILYLGWQLFVSYWNSDFARPIRWDTLFFSIGLTCTYIGFYNLIFRHRIFTLEHFIKILKFLIWAYFIVCVLQQVVVATGRTLPVINLTYNLQRGLGCNSLALEPSHFARIMLVCFYCFVKCMEYRRKRGRFSVKELFCDKELRRVTIPWLWMMCTMGSATAYCCLIVFSLYFVTGKNFVYMLPAVAGLFIFMDNLDAEQFEQAHRATSTINATISGNPDEIKGKAGSSRIAPLLNSLQVDFSDMDTWLGLGIDYAKDNNLIVSERATLFDDYGLIFYLIGMTFNFLCAYRFKSLGSIFMLLALAGGTGTNIHYAWELMMVMTCENYFFWEREKEKKRGIEKKEEMLS
ncbi:MAG: hypothetical protein MJ016_00635 [Victivallaceae bacterium]|nr:hypothetical protein [Victivallaceae bacterium]